MQKIVLFTFSILFLFLPITSAAHVKSTTKVSVFILDNQQYKITIEADILHLLQQQLIGSTNDKDMIEQINQLSMFEFISAIKSIKNNLKENSQISFDQKLMPVTQLNGPSLKDIKILLNNPVGNEGYPVIYSGIGKVPEGIKTVAFRLPTILGDIKLSVAQPHVLLLASHQKSAEIVLKHLTQKPSALIEKVALISTYIYQGYIHIIPKGLDHILFILALFLLSSKFSSLLWQVSAFTLAHTITLALGIFGLVNISPAIIEPLIALSIAYIAIENIYSNKLHQGRIAIIFAFGLLHGLGFASVLLELGLAPEQYITSLIAFNVGVELAQIMVLLLALLVFYRFQTKAWYKQHIVQPTSLIIAIVALYWFIERTF